MRAPRLASLMTLLLAFTANASISLEGNTDSLEIVTSAAGSVDYFVAWSNVTATALTTPGTSAGNITTAATTTAVAAPAASNWRYLRSITVWNVSATTSQLITVQVNRSASTRRIWRGTLAPGTSLNIDDNGLDHVYGTNGVERINSDAPGFNGRSFMFAKSATAVDTTGFNYMFAKDPGMPGAFVLGTPGLNGANLDCSTAGGAAVAGSPVLLNPATGGWYLTRFGVVGQVPNTYQLLDLIWYNTGLVVTTTTEQALTSPVWPARDVNGAVTGEGLGIALYSTAANTNAAAIASTTVRYTNTQGVANRTATFTAQSGFQAPATPVIGTWMPFQLQAGDTGVQSIQGVTLGTSYVTGTLSLFVYSQLASDGLATSNFPSGSLVSRQMLNPGVRVWNGTCLNVSVMGAPQTTAPSFTNGVIELMER